MVAATPLEVTRSTLFAPLHRRAILIADEKVYYAERQHWMAMTQPAYETLVFTLIIVYAAIPWQDRWAIIGSILTITPATVLLVAGGQLRTRLGNDPFTNPVRQANRTRLAVVLIGGDAFLVFLGFNWLLYVSIVVIIGRLIIYLTRWAFYERRYITNRRVIEAGGLWGSRISTMPFSRVTDINYTRTVVGEIFGYASMRVETAGQEQALGLVRFIDNPTMFYEILIQFSAPAEDG